MTTPKAFLCRCEDLTVQECRQAVRDGYACLEDLKRFLGVGTGPCQGKSCVQAAMAIVAEERAIPLGQVDVMTFRPPVRPIPFATLAASDATDAAVPGAGPAPDGPLGPAAIRGGVPARQGSVGARKGRTAPTPPPDGAPVGHSTAAEGP